MESTYPEIYMNLWQEMRQMQKRGEGKMAGRELPGYNYSGSEMLPGKVWC